MLKKVLNFFAEVKSFVKDHIIDFFKENGFTSVAVLCIAVLFGLTGHSRLFWVLLGVFIGINWQIIKQLWKESKLKNKIDDVVDDVVDDVKKVVKKVTTKKK